MRLVEEGVSDSNGANGVLNPNGGTMNGKGLLGLRSVEDESSEEEDEEDEPVSATLILRVISEPASPGASRKHSAATRRNQPPSFLGGEDLGDTFLQVQVQRSTSSASLSGRQSSRSRPPSATPSLYVTEPDASWPLSLREPGRDPGLYRDASRDFIVSRDTSRESSLSPTPSLYGHTSLDTYKNKLSAVEMLQRVGQHTRAMESGLKELRRELDQPTRLLDIGQETIVLSGLNKQAADSLKNIKNLYDETKYLKAYLDKLEARVHYDMVMRRAQVDRPPWYRRLLFLCAVSGAAVFIWYKIDPQGCEARLAKVGQTSLDLLDTTREYFSTNHNPSSAPVVLQ